LLRYLEECSDATIEEAAMLAACLQALSGPRHDEAERTGPRRAYRTAAAAS
jgi:hypothetical protein